MTHTVAPESPASNPIARLKPILYLLGIAGLAIALLTIDQPSAEDVPSLGRLATGMALTVASLWFAANQWSSLLELSGGPRRRAHGAVYLSQLAKYLPAGGLLQIAGQVSLTESEEYSPGNRLFLYLVGVIQLCGASAIAGLLLIAQPGADLWWVALIVAPLGLGTLAPVLRKGSLILVRFRRLTVQLPQNQTLLRGQVLAAANILALAAAFAAVVAAPELTSILATMGAFALAWLAGFLVLPIPAGVGVREVALVGLLPSLSPGQILVGGLFLRLFGLVAEVLLLAGTSLTTRARRAD